MASEKEVSLLKEKISQIDHLIETYSKESLRQWREETLMILDSLIEADSKYYKNFEDIGYHATVFAMGDAHGNELRNRESYEAGLLKAKASLNAIIFGLEKGLI